MIVIQQLLVGILLYIPFTIARSKIDQNQNKNVTISLLNESNAARINDLIITSNDSVSNTVVDELVQKIADLSQQYKKDANATVTQVMRLLNSDQTLPRLTRGEIIDILENLTRSNPNDLRKLVNKSRQDYQRALMLVMPYTTKNTGSFNIEELFTKPPITRIIGSETEKSTNPKKNLEVFDLEPSTYRPPFNKRPFNENIQPSNSFESKVKKPTKQKPKVTTLKPQRFTNHRYSDEIVPVSTPAPNLEFGHKSTTRRTPTIRTSTVTTTTIQIPVDIGIPDEMKSVIKDVSFNQKYSSQYDASLVQFPKEETTTENIREILNSIGAVTPNDRNTTVPDVSEVVGNLSADMRELLLNFGLIDDPDKKITSNTTSKPEREPEREPEPEPDEIKIKPESFTRFKPLPDSAPVRDDMEEFLATFGLIGNSQRTAKDLPIIDEKPETHLSKVPEIDMELIPETMHSILDDIGLTDRKNRKLPEVIEPEEIKDPTHIFNPETTNVSEREIRRLNQLMETIKRLQELNRTATIEDLKHLDLENIKELTKILKQDVTAPLDQQNFGPDPLNFDTSADKNEVKRQEVSTTTEEAKNPPIAALEESFGGPSTSVSSVTEEASLPPPRKTGFYYLVDWNTFLEVGEEGKNKVNIRFSPSAGDPSRFLSVKVP